MTRLQLTNSDNGKTLDLPRDTQLVLALDENPSTGYRWTVDPVQPPLLVLLSDEYMIKPAVGYGGGGIRQLVFRPVKSGEVLLSLRLTRAWDESIALRFAVSVKVQ